MAPKATAEEKAFLSVNGGWWFRTQSKGSEMDNWDITRTQYRVSDFLSWQRAKSLVLSPSFQRRPVWKTGAKSYLVDTVVRGLPMPIIFLREQKTDLESLEPKREVV